MCHLIKHHRLVSPCTCFHYTRIKIFGIWFMLPKQNSSRLNLPLTTFHLLVSFIKIIVSVSIDIDHINNSWYITYSMAILIFWCSQILESISLCSYSIHIIRKVKVQISGKRVFTVHHPSILSHSQPGTNTQPPHSTLCTHMVQLWYSSVVLLKHVPLTIIHKSEYNSQYIYRNR